MGIFKVIGKYGEYAAKIDETGRLFLKCRSDSTAYFRIEMITILTRLECTDIQCKGYKVPDELMPYGSKPWCNWVDEVSGIVPESKRGELYGLQK